MTPWCEGNPLAALSRSTVTNFAPSRDASQSLTFGQAKAGERRRKCRGVLRRRLGTSSWLMPIPIPLRKIAAFVESADPNVVGNLLIEAFRRKILPSGVRDKCDSAFFLHMIAARKCIFLFDGLDEVSDDAHFQALTREIIGDRK